MKEIVRGCLSCVGVFVGDVGWMCEYVWDESRRCKDVLAVCGMLL